MKNIFGILGVMALCVLLVFTGIYTANRGNIKISHSEDQEHYKFAACYPDEVSDAVISHINEWANPATQKSGNLPGRLKLKFSDGISCTVHTERRKLEITANRIDNDSTSLASLKKEFKTINDLILAQANELR